MLCEDTFMNFFFPTHVKNLGRNLLEAITKFAVGRMSQNICKI